MAEHFVRARVQMYKNRNKQGGRLRRRPHVGSSKHVAMDTCEDTADFCDFSGVMAGNAALKSRMWACVCNIRQQILHLIYCRILLQYITSMHILNNRRILVGYRFTKKHFHVFPKGDKVTFRISVTYVGIRVATKDEKVLLKGEKPQDTWIDIILQNFEIEHMEFVRKFQSVLPLLNHLFFTLVALECCHRCVAI